MFHIDHLFGVTNTGPGPPISRCRSLFTYPSPELLDCPVPLFVLLLLPADRRRFPCRDPFPANLFAVLDLYKEAFESILEVLVLGAVPTPDNHHAGGDVLEADGGIGDIFVLSPGPAGTEGRYAALFFELVQIHRFSGHRIRNVIRWRSHKVEHRT